jgi:MATE family multidrug resistance protein
MFNLKKKKFLRRVYLILYNLLTLNIPTFLGHLSKEALAASALSDLWTMTTSVLLSGRIVGVLIGGAVGAGNPKLAGIYLQISYVVIFSLSIFVFLAWNCTERVWLAFGSDPEISKMAGDYARSLSFAIPGMIGFSQLSQFFSAQKIMYPEVNASTIGLVANLIFGLIFVLGWPIKGFDGYGFNACPIVTTVVTYVQLAFMVIVYVHFLKLHSNCWPGFKMSEITWKRIKTFSELYFPAALSSASDFWRVAVIGSVAAKLGDAEVAIFNTAYRIMWIALIFISAISSAASIDMSIRLGKMDPHGARQAGYVGIGMAIIALCVLSTLILYHTRTFGLIFTSDEELLACFKDCSIPFTITLFFMNLSVAIERIPYSMG